MAQKLDHKSGTLGVQIRRSQRVHCILLGQLGAGTAGQKLAVVNNENLGGYWAHSHTNLNLYLDETCLTES